jgi:16S rRNA (cytosine967-C5)-methyltransferase
MKQIQKMAAGALQAVLSGAALHQVLPPLLRQLDAPSERGALQDLLYGSLRHLGRVDVWLDALLERPLSDPKLGWLLRVALYQLAFTRAPAHAVVNNAVAAAGQGWRPGLANAVLRNFLRRRAELDALAQATPAGRWSHPQWWIDKLRTQRPADWEAMLEASLMHPPFTLRINLRRCTVADYQARLGRAGIAARATGPQALTLDKAVAVDALPGFADGDVSVQDAGAQWAATLLDLGPGQRVLDACAAPGGKSGHILELADVELTALDVDRERLRRVRENLERLGRPATLLEGDAATPERWWDGRAFDRVLADVPCSASGVVRRNPDIKWLRRPDDIARFAHQQAAILDALWRVLAPGGKFLYATCSVFDEENDAQVEAFLARHPEAELCALPEPVDKGQLLPDAEHDGFFYALLRKP